MKHQAYRRYYCLMAFLFVMNAAAGQTAKQAKMEQLSFMVGEWVGTSTVYENGVVARQGPAYEKISYDLSKHIMVVQLNAESLQLHTIIYYDTQDETYYYYPFSKNGVNRYPAAYQDGQLVVQPSASRRFIFSRTANGGFREYGERLVNGQWIMYFEDTFTNTQ